MAGLSTAFVLTLALTMSATAQMTYRLKGTVKDNDGKPVAGARLASAALMQNDLDVAAKMLWNALDVLPRDQRPAYGAALKDLQQITGTK